MLRKKEEIARASREYRKGKSFRENFVSWYGFMDLLCHQILEDFGKLFGSVYCQFLFKYISFVFNHFLF